MTDAEIRKLAHQHLDGTGDHCILNFARAIMAAAPVAPAEPTEWRMAEAVSNRPDVHAALKSFSHDPTGDNAIYAVQTVLDAAPVAQQEPPAAIAQLVVQDGRGEISIAAFDLPTGTYPLYLGADMHKNPQKLCTSAEQDQAANLNQPAEQRIAELEAENANLLQANQDCIDHFNAVKADYDALLAAPAEQGERKPDDAKDAERYRKVLFQEYKDYQRKARIAELSILPFNDYVNQYNAILDAPKWDDA